MPKRALIIANGRFKDKRISPLASPVSDGKRLQALLQRADVGDYQVKLCADGDTPEVKIAVERFFDSAEHDDLLVLLISGHGKKDKRGNLYFLTSDTDLDALSATAVEARFFTDRMNESAASKQIVFVDTCYSGAFVKDATFKSVEVDVRADDMLRDSSLADDAEGKAIIMASAGHQLAQEKGKTGSEPVQSLFTKHLIEGIESGEADPDGTGRITLDNLYNHCRRGLKRDGAGQEPEWRLSRLSGQFEIARNPVAQTALPQDLQARMARPERDIRAGTIDELRALAEGPDMLQRRRATEALRQLALDDTVLVATAATLALRKLGLADDAEDKAEAARLERERMEREITERMQREQADRAKHDREQEERAKQDHEKPERKSGAGWMKWAAGGFAAIVGIALVIDSQQPPAPVYPVTPDAVDPEDPAPAPVVPDVSASPAVVPPAPATDDSYIAQGIQQLVAVMRLSLPQQVDQFTTLSDVSSNGKTIIYSYDVSFDPNPEQLARVQSTQLELLKMQVCNPQTADLFRKGARMVAEYHFPSIESLSFTLTSCDPDQSASRNMRN